MKKQLRLRFDHHQDLIRIESNPVKIDVIEVPFSYWPSTIHRLPLKKRVRLFNPQDFCQKPVNAEPAAEPTITSDNKGESLQRVSRFRVSPYERPITRRQSRRLAIGLSILPVNGVSTVSEPTPKRRKSMAKSNKRNELKSSDNDDQIGTPMPKERNNQQSA